MSADPRDPGSTRHYRLYWLSPPLVIFLLALLLVAAAWTINRVRKQRAAENRQTLLAQDDPIRRPLAEAARVVRTIGGRQEELFAVASQSADDDASPPEPESVFLWFRRWASQSMRIGHSSYDAKNHYLHVDGSVDGRWFIDGVTLMATPYGLNLGIGVRHPHATLDVQGYARLKVYEEAPHECLDYNDGALALTHNYRLCVCKSGTGWLESSDGATPCRWQ